jgi:hypothetical protein
MRYVEIKGGIQLPLSNEERRLFEEIEDKKLVPAEELDERDAELARKMTSRGALLMIENEDESIAYVVNKLEEIWRD